MAAQLERYRIAYGARNKWGVFPHVVEGELVWALAGQTRHHLRRGESARSSETENWKTCQVSRAIFVWIEWEQRIGSFPLKEALGCEIQFLSGH